MAYINNGFLLYWELCFKVIYESESVQFAEKEDNITVYKKSDLDPNDDITRLF